MHAVLINPSLVVQRNDPFTTGIVYMPVCLAYVAASLRAHGVGLTVIDAYAEKPRQVRRQGQFYVYGLKPAEVIDRVPEKSLAIFVYAINLTNHIATVEIVHALKEAYPATPVIILENTQAVTAYALKHVAEEFYKAGADYILTGEGEHRAVRVIQYLAKGVGADEIQRIDGLGTPGFYSPPVGQIQDLDTLPFPAWELFPLHNYWSIHHAHGPLETDRYLPLLTSRGCPYPCRFCVVPETNDTSWRARSAANVADEIEAYSRKFHLTEFHVEDLNPTISDTRVRAICREIEQRNLNVTWKIAAGTKVESIKDEETIELMARAGCRYISISPETGSGRLLKLMKKPFNLQHAVRIVKKMSEVGIRSQACFVLGFPGETSEDLRLTWDLVRELTRVGVDEIALFIITPVPGAALHYEFAGYENLSQLNFSPTWRQDYPRLNKFRLHLYGSFLLWKLRYHPRKLLRQPLNFLRRRFETKMEMAPYRAWTTTWLSFLAR